MKTLEGSRRFFSSSALLCSGLLHRCVQAESGSSLGNPMLGQDLLQGNRELGDDQSVFIPENKSDAKA